MNELESIDKQQTHKIYELQISIVRKIISGMLWRQEFDKQLAFYVCRFCFSNPITFTKEVYTNISKGFTKGGTSFILYDSLKNKNQYLQVRGVWKVDSIDRWEIGKMAKHFTRFAELDKLNIQNEEEDQNKIKIVSQKSSYFKLLFKFASVFHKDGKMDEWIREGLRKLMSYRMLKIKLNSRKEILYIHCQKPIDIFTLLGKQNKKKFQLEFEDDKWKIKGEYEVFQKTKEVKQRGKWKLLKDSGCTVQFDDIFTNL